MRLRPTELGLKGVLLLAALDVAFLATPYGNLFFLLLVFCVVVGTTGAVWTLWNLRALRVVLLEMPPGPAGEPRPLHVAVERTARGAAFDLAVKLEAGDVCTELLHLPRLVGRAIVAATLPGLPRGVHVLQHVQVVTRHPFGLFQATRALPAAGELVVHPRPIGPGELEPGEVPEGALGGPPGRPGTSIAGLRPFRPGDAVADVHWKATARRGAPVIKERERDAGDSLDIVLDRRADGAAFERALGVATGLLLAAVAGDRPVQLRSQGLTARVGGGHGSPTAVLRWLAATEPLPADGPPPPAGGADAVRLPGARSPAHRAQEASFG